MITDIVLCGFPRSGSSLLYSLLIQSVSSHWFPAGEYAYPAMLEALGRAEEMALDESCNTDFYAPFAHIFHHPYGDDDIYEDMPFLSKQPYDIFRVRDGIIPDEVPLIITIRDPRDVLLSKHHVTISWGVDDYFIDADHKYTFTHESRPLKNGPGLLDYAAAIDAVIRRRKGRNVFICRYENLIADPDKVQDGIGGIGVQFKGEARFSDWDSITPEGRLDPRQGEIRRALNDVREIDPANTGKWRHPEHARRIVDQFSRFPQLQDWLLLFGYEQSGSQWLDSLKVLAE